MTARAIRRWQPATPVPTLTRRHEIEHVSVCLERARLLGWVKDVYHSLEYQSVQCFMMPEIHARDILAVNGEFLEGKVMSNDILQKQKPA